MRARLIPSLLLVLAFAGCGETGDTPAPPGEAPLKAPAQPEAALAWVEAVRDDGAALRARLDAWPLDDPAFERRTETQLALTWRLQLALRDGDVERAESLWFALLDRFDGEGQYPRSRSLSAMAVRMAVFDEALNEARRRMDGSRPDLAAARSALEVADTLRDVEDEDASARLAGVSAWVLRGTLGDVLAAVDAEVAVPEDARAVLVVLSDDFTLGETLFREVLAQWARDHGAGSFHRVLVPLLRGRVRVSLRLVDAESREEELASIQQRALDAGLARTSPIPVARLARLGLEEGDAAMALADGRGRIVARLAGRFPDPRVLEPALQRLLSR